MKVSTGFKWLAATALCLTVSACVQDDLDASEVFGECTAQGDDAGRRTVEAHPSDALYDPVLVNLEMTVAQKDLDVLNAIFNSCLNKARCEDLPLSAQTPTACCKDSYRQEYVPATVTFAGASVPAEVRLKGNPSDWDAGDIYQFVIRFNGDDKAGRLLGQRRLNLEGRRHGSLVRNASAMWLMRQVGLAAPRVNWLKLVLNGDTYAVYENIEAVDREFLERHFTDPDGNLYKHLLATELKTNEKAANTNDIEALQTLFSLGPDAVGDGLSCAADVNQWIRLAAAEATLPAADNFFSSNFNLYGYNDPIGGWTIIPWDLDDVMYSGATWNTNIETGSPSDLGSWWGTMSTNASWAAKFRSEVAQSLSKYRGLTQQITTWCCDPNLRAAITEAQAHFSQVDSFDKGCLNTIGYVQCRVRYLDDVLKGGSGNISCNPDEIADSTKLTCAL